MGGYFIGVPPLRSGGLVGRVDLLSQARELLLKDEDVALIGLGGVGKSALASSLVRDEKIQSRLDSGVLWLSVGKTQLEEPPWRFQLLDWARDLGAPKDRMEIAERQGTSALCELIHHSLGNKKVLLVFDDVWDQREVLLFKDLGAECQRVMTSRMRTLGSLFSAAGLVPVDDLSDTDARALFSRLAPTVVDRRPEAAGRCIAAVGRLPLVLVIVASYLQAQAIDDPTSLDEALAKVLDVERRLELAPPVSKSEVTLLPEGTTVTLDAVIGLTADSLSLDDRRALTSLTAFPPKLNSFTWEAAQYVAASREAVLTLRRNGLVEDLAAVEQRLTMHQTIHDYASRGAKGEPQAYRRMAEYFLQYIERQANALDAEEWFTSLEQEKDNIRAVLEWALDQKEVRLGLQLMAELWPYWYRRSRYARAIQFADGLLAHRVDDESKDFLLLRAKIFNDAGNFAYNMGDLAGAERRHLESLSIRSNLDHDTVAGSWNNLGLIERERGHYEAAERLFTKALERNKSTGQSNWQAINLDNLGINAHRTGNLQSAEDVLRGSAAMFADQGDRWGVAMANLDLASVLIEGNRLHEAQHLLAQSLTDRWEVGDEKLSAAALRALASVASREGDHDLSVELLSASLSLSIPVLDRLGEHQSLMDLTLAYSNRGENSMVLRIAGVLDALRSITGMVASPRASEALAQVVDRARADLGDAAAAAEMAGRAAAVAEAGVPDLEGAIATCIETVDVPTTVAQAQALAQQR
jgi:tetratricopeptide (TPR) repeat protein